MWAGHLQGGAIEVLHVSRPWGQGTGAGRGIAPRGTRKEQGVTENRPQCEGCVQDSQRSHAFEESLVGSGCPNTPQGPPALTAQLPRKPDAACGSALPAIFINGISQESC